MEGLTVNLALVGQCVKYLLPFVVSLRLYVYMWVMANLHGDAMEPDLLSRNSEVCFHC